MAKLTKFRRTLLELAHKSDGGLNAEFMSKAEERAAWAMTQMSEPLLLPTYWGPFDYTITPAGRAILTQKGE